MLGSFKKAQMSKISVFTKAVFDIKGELWVSTILECNTGEFTT